MCVAALCCGGDVVLVVGDVVAAVVVLFHEHVTAAALRNQSPVIFLKEQCLSAGSECAIGLLGCANS